MSNRWLVVRESDGVCTNAVVWDGVSKWSPPAGEVALPYPEGGAGIGWIYDFEAQSWSAPPEQEE